MRFPLRALALSATLTAGACGLNAAAISFVTTLTSMWGSANSNYDSVTGLYQSAGNCYLKGGGTGPCATPSSTPSNNVLGLTAASVALSNGVSFNPQNGISGYGSASAAADLATGILRVATNGPDCSTPNLGYCGSGANAAAQFQDALTFTNTSGQTADVALQWSFDGSITATGAWPSEDFSSRFCFAPGNDCAPGNSNSLHQPPNPGFFFEFSEGGGNAPVITNTFRTGPNWVSTAIVPGGNATSEEFQGIFAIPTGTSSYTLNAYVDATCYRSNCDFSHTAAFSIGTLPQGVGFSSQSGVLLTADTADAPEPSSWMLALSGVALVALGRRRTG